MLHCSLLNDRPPWSFNGADLDLDFANGRGWVAPGRNALRDLLTVTRASVGYAEYESGVWLPSASGVARITDKGLLVEEARTNEIRNNSMQGAVVGTIGSGGTLPTGWSTSGGTGLTISVVEVGTENGVDYIDIRLVGTTGSTFTIIQPVGLSVVTAAEGETWTTSWFYALAGGSLTNISTTQIIQVQAGGAGQTAVDVTPTSTLQRGSSTRTLPASTTHAIPRYTVNYSSGVAVDITVRLGWPQMEEGAFVTSPIRTTTAAATRAADVVSLTAPIDVTQPWWVYAEVKDEIGPQSTFREIFSIGVNGSNDIARLRYFNTNVFQMAITSGGSSQFSPSSTTLSGTNTYKFAGSFETGDHRYIDSKDVTLKSGTGNNPTAGANLYLGTNSASAGLLNALLKRIAFGQGSLSTAAMTELVS